MSEERFNKAKNWFENLREEIIDIIHKIDGKEFNISDWEHKSGGGGKISKIIGNVIEKGGVNISSVSGKFNDEMGSKIPGAENNPAYKATGISIVLHPLSPKIPSMHFNTRFLQTEKEWFGGGMDVTPCLPFEGEQEYHLLLEKMCNKNGFHPILTLSAIPDPVFGDYYSILFYNGKNRESNVVSNIKFYAR